jgi:hypothetical protein
MDEAEEYLAGLAAAAGGRAGGRAGGAVNIGKGDLSVATGGARGYVMATGDARAEGADAAVDAYADRVARKNAAVSAQAW